MTCGDAADTPSDLLVSLSVVADVARGLPLSRAPSVPRARTVTTVARMGEDGQQAAPTRRATAERAVQTAMADQAVSRVAPAEATGIPRVTLVRRLSGRAPFTVTELAAVAGALGVPLTDLLPSEVA